MTRERLLAWRLANHHLAAARTGDPAQLVAHFGAVQAQEYGQALWAVGLRTARATVGTIEAAVERGVDRLRVVAVGGDRRGHRVRSHQHIALGGAGVRAGVRALAAPAASRAAAPPAAIDAEKDYQTQKFRGWTLKVNKRLLAERHDAHRKDVLELLDDHLYRIGRVVPAEALFHERPAEK